MAKRSRFIAIAAAATCLCACGALSAQVPQLPEAPPLSSSNEQLASGDAFTEPSISRLPSPMLADGTTTATESPAVDWRSLARPRVRFAAGWEPESDGVNLSQYDLRVTVPTYPFWGPPPPLITAGYSLTLLDPVGDLPDQLHDFSLGAAWMRRINDAWLARFMVTAAFASDLRNTSSDAWQIRGGGFALFQPNERWSFAFGALATGRNDLPVLPAAGAIWTPAEHLRIEMMMPKPRVTLLLKDDGARQTWGYFGGEMAGGRWAFRRANGVDDELNYREWRIMLGWESMASRPRGSFRPASDVRFAEVGIVLGREFEFERIGPDQGLGNALLLRVGFRQ